MEFYRNGKRQKPPTPEQLREQGLVRRASELPALTSRQRAIVARYGPSEAAIAAFRSEMVHEYSYDYERRLERPLPTLIELRNCYPENPDVTQAIMLNLVNGTIEALGEEQRVDAADRLSIARGLCGNRKFRSLSMTSILQFFYRLQTGEIETDGWLRPARFLKLANDWVRSAESAERYAAIKREREQRMKEKEELASRPSFEQRWEAYKREHGIPQELSWAAWIAVEGEKERTRRRGLIDNSQTSENKQL